MPKKKATKLVKTYNPWISVKKFFTGLAMAGIPFIIAYAIQFLETEEFPPEYASVLAILIGFLHLLANLVKHWNDVEEVPV